MVRKRGDAAAPPDVVAVELGSRPLIVLEPEMFGIEPPGVEGAIVWFTPPADVEPHEVMAFKRLLQEKAARVVPLPPRAGLGLSEAPAGEPVDLNLRALAASLIPKSADEGLRSMTMEIIEQAFAKVGL